jgi:hypothetical protein
MSVIKPQPRMERQSTRQSTTIKLDVPLIRALKLYAEYIDSPQEWVVNEGLRLAFIKDEEFLQWLRTHHPDAADSLSSHGTPRRSARKNRRQHDKPTPPTIGKSME